VPGLTAIIITRDEARHIGAALASVAFADERIVVDSHSVDDTTALAAAAGARVDVRDWAGYGPQRNHAASLAAHDWILALDADERVTPELAAEIAAILRGTPSAAGYRIPRVTRYLGRWIRTTDWFPDWQLRFYDRTRASWNARPVHESVEVRGPVGRLRGELQHHAYRDLAHHLDTINRYTTLAAGQMLAEGRRSGPARATSHAALAFLRNYLLRRGVADGRVGFVVSAMNAYYVWLKFVKLWALQRNDGAGAGGAP
jgi:glycosyltransferase involved in cell wall biosynthesis